MSTASASSASRHLWASMDGLVSDLGPGAYCILFEIDRDLTIQTGGLGQVLYRAGVYAYVGSAAKGISTRVRHHLRPPRRPHWHIDYLRPEGRPVAIVAAESDPRAECAIARHLGRGFPTVRAFGSSDCKCTGHLFHGEETDALLNAAEDAVRAAGCEPKVIVDAAVQRRSRRPDGAPPQ